MAIPLYAISKWDKNHPRVNLEKTKFYKKRNGFNYYEIRFSYHGKQSDYSTVEWRFSYSTTNKIEQEKKCLEALEYLDGLLQSNQKNYL